MDIRRTCNRCGREDSPHRQFVQNGCVKTRGRCRLCESEAQQVKARAHPFKHEYTSWRHMLQRCTNPNATSYADYGGRGIHVCERWLSFDSFLEDMGPKPSSKHQIDRVNNSGHYSPDNCKWSTAVEQNCNRRDTRRITFDGATQSLRAWCRELGIPWTTLHDRLRRGWSVERAFTTRTKRSRPE